MIERARADAGAADAASRRIGILTTDTTLVLTSWDPVLAAMTGIAADAAVGRPLTDVIPDLETRHLLEAIREPLETGGVRVLAPALHGYLIRCQPPPSSCFDRMRQRVVIGPLKDGDQTVGLAVTIEDVTDRLEREQLLASELRQADPAARLRAIRALEQHEPIEGAGPLARAMADEDWHVRRTAVRALASRRDPSIVETLVTALRDQHRNFSVLSSALQLLSMTGVDLASALIDLLRQDDADLRIQAALALGAQTDPRAIDALMIALDDPDANVRFHAIEALGKLAPPSAVERLAAIAESNDFFLAFPALDALARIRDPAVAPRVVPLLKDPLVGEQAAEVLGQIGDEDAVAPLVLVLDRDDAAVAGVVDALAAIRRRYLEELGVAGHIEDLVRRSISPTGAQRIIDAAARSTDASLKNLITVLGWLRGPAVERALTHMLGAAAVHQELIEAIVRFGSPMVDRLIDQLRDGDVATRRAAVIALGHIGDARAVPALIDLIEQDDRELLVAAAGALARLGDGRAFDPLIGLLDDPDLPVRHAAIGALNSIGHPDMPARIRALLDAPGARLRESSVKIAGYFGYRECADALLARCADSDESVRAAALEHVAFLDDGRRALPVLLAALDGDTPRARAAAAQALAHLPPADVQPILQRAMSDRDPWVRYFAAASLGRQQDRGSLAVLERAARSDDHEHVRIAAVGAIGAIGGDAAARVLGALLEGAETEVARAAIAALGQTTSAAALEPLKIALHAVDPARREAAAAAIVRWGQSEAVELLKWAAAGDVESAVAAAATLGLSRIGSGSSAAAPLAIDALAALTADPARRQQAVAALARVSPAAIPRVGGCLTSRDPHVRQAVVEALGRLSHPSASAYVRGALEDTDPLVRQRAVVVLARLGSRGMAPSFAEMARNDPSDRVRRAAGAALRRADIAADDARGAGR
jgi:HEAT repeat protein